VIAVDTNILVYAHRRDSAWHQAAAPAVRSLAEGGTPWAIPWPCVHEFLAIVTNPRIYRPPTPVVVAVEQVDAWLRSPRVTLLGESPGYWDLLREIVVSRDVVGAKVHDARIATLARHHGVAELWSADRDFSRFPDIATRNPLVGA